MIVVDTSALINYLRGSTSPAAGVLDELESRGTPFVIPSLCFMEVLQGARDDEEWRLLDRHLSTQRFLALELDAGLYESAARIFFDCRRHGLTVRSSVDCLVAEQVLRCDGILLHDDEDFERIAQVRPLRTLAN